MDVNPGTRLGPYEIVARIGAGGMGEVFRARDTRLERSVAIKVLPADFARNAQMKIRFEREARVISQLNHPNICTLYDVGDHYLVMELLEGESLADRLVRGPLPLPEVLKLGAQIADALDRAHRAGIVHRDLKPGNVMLTRSGAKLLDFGLAKSFQQDVVPDGVTFTMHHDNKPLTQEGTIIGTFQYMAPEQLEAEEADARTDIFSLGAVLYEMATGVRAFQGKTRTSLIAAIVGAQPRPVSETVALTPPALDHVIQKCLEKEREDRWQSAHDVAEELKWIGTAPLERKAKTAKVAKIAVAAAIALAVALAGAIAMYQRAKNAPKPRTAFAVLPPDGYAIGAVMLSPDGTMIAFDAVNTRTEGGVWVRRLDQVEAKRLTTNLNDHVVAWTPDSKWVAYTTDRQLERQLMRIAVAGGTPEVISQHGKSISNGTWASDGTILYGRTWGHGLSALRQDGAEPVVVTRLDPKRRESIHAYPQFLPDGKRFLYLIHTFAEQKNEIWAGSLDGKVKKLILRADSLVGLARSHLFFVRDGAIYAQSFDDDRLEVTGQPRRVAERIDFSEAEASAGASVDANGALLYWPIRERTYELGWYDRSGRRLEKVFTDVDTRPQSLSRDGTKVAALRRDHTKGADDVYAVDLARGIRTRITSGLANHGSPFWSPAGDRVYFSSDRAGMYDIYAQAEDGTTPAVTIWKSDRDKHVADVSPAGGELMVQEQSIATRTDLWLVPLGSPEKRRPLVATEANEYGGSFSPDGRWIAWWSDRSGRIEIYMRRLEGGRVTQISTTGAAGYLWSADGSAIYMRTLTNDRVSIPLTFQGNDVVPGKPIPLFTAPARDHDIIGETEKGLLIWTVPDPSDYLAVLHYDSAPLQ